VKVHVKQKRIKTESDIDDDDDSFSEIDQLPIIEEEEKMSERINVKRNPINNPTKHNEVTKSDLSNRGENLEEEEEEDSC
jgi:hypothetical protein